MDHYDSLYFEWQKKSGTFGGKIELSKFNEFIKPTDRIIDFGCGGGFLLKNIKCQEKIGIEINETARNFAIDENQITVLESTDEIENEWADIIISNHALEHTQNPLIELSKLKDKLKKNGLIIIVVPQEFKTKYHKKDNNQHLYTWTPLTLGNLLRTAGLDVISSKTLIHKWPPFYDKIYALFGKSIFNIISFLYCIITRSGYQVKSVGRK